MVNLLLEDDKPLLKWWWFGSPSYKKWWPRTFRGTGFVWVFQLQSGSKCGKTQFLRQSMCLVNLTPTGSWGNPKSPNSFFLEFQVGEMSSTWPDVYIRTVGRARHGFRSINITRTMSSSRVHLKSLVTCLSRMTDGMGDGRVGRSWHLT